MNVSKNRLSEEGRIRYDWIKDWKAGDLLTNEDGDTMLLTGIDLDQTDNWAYEGRRHQHYYPKHREGSTYAKLLINNLTKSKNLACYVSYTMKDFAGDLYYGESREGKPALPFWQFSQKADIERERLHQKAMADAQHDAECAFDGLIHDWLGPWEDAIRKNPIDFMLYMDTIKEVNGKPVSNVQLVEWAVNPKFNTGVQRYDNAWELEVRVKYEMDGKDCRGSNNGLFSFNTSDDWEPWGAQ